MEKKIIQTFSVNLGRTRKQMEITLDELLDVSDGVYEKALNTIDNALDQAGLEPDDIDLVILAGGSSQLPGIAQKIEDKIGIKPMPIPKNLMMSIASGAAVHQKEVFNYPHSSRSKAKVGTTVGIKIEENGKVITHQLFPYNQELPHTVKQKYRINPGQETYTLELSSVVDRAGMITRPLKKRIIPVRNGQSEVVVEMTMNEDKVLDLVSYDPKNPGAKTSLSLNQADQISDINKNRKNLNIEIDKVNGTELQPFIGIDLGTTTCEFALLPRSMDNNEFSYLKNPELITNYSEHCFPSVIYFDEENEITHIADIAACNALNDAGKADQVISNFKVEPRDKTLRKAFNHSYSVKDLEALMLSKILNTAKSEMPQFDWKEAVITVPAGYTIDQTQEVIEAAKIAGFEKVSLINEPTAAFKYYSLIQSIPTDEIRNVLVFDFGGGTTDVTIFDIHETRHNLNNSDIDSNYSVIGQGSALDCGGKNIDDALQKIVIENLFDGNSDLNPAILTKIRNGIELVKIELSRKYQEMLDNE